MKATPCEFNPEVLCKKETCLTIEVKRVNGRITVVKSKRCALYPKTLMDLDLRKEGVNPADIEQW
jgi:hypothetical protein